MQRSLSALLAVHAACSSGEPSQPIDLPSTAVVAGSAASSVSSVSSAPPSTEPSSRPEPPCEDGKHTPLSRFLAVDLGEPKKPEPLTKYPCPEATCYRDGHGAGAWYTGSVRVGLKAKSNGDRCAARTIEELERRLSYCSVTRFTVSGSPAWLARGSLTLDRDKAGAVVATNIKAPEALGGTFGWCAEKEIAELELVGDDRGAPIEVPLVFESVVTTIAE